MVTKTYKKYSYGSSLGNEEKNAEFCCTLTAKHHVVPSAAYRGNSEAPLNNDII